MKNVIFLSMICFVVLLIVANASASLTDNGDGTVTQIRNDGSMLMWLKDARYPITSGYDADGEMPWGDAVSWANNLVYEEYTDWRLPSAYNSDGSGPSNGSRSTDSEMGNLYYVELGNIGWADGQPPGWDVNTGLFQNLGSNNYWTSTEFSSDYAWIFAWNDGDQGAGPKDYGLHGFAWAVRDVNVVPEPISATLFLVGSAVLGMVSVRRKRT